MGRTASETKRKAHPKMFTHGNRNPVAPGEVPTPGPMAADPAAAGTDTAAGPSAGPREVPSGPPAEAPPVVAIPHTRTAQTWFSLSAGMVMLVVVLVFILQNLHSVKVHFLWATWTIPLAVDLLLATVLGGLIMFTVGSVRIVQLRRLARRNLAAAAPGRPTGRGPVG